jgi:hypothetical protein
MSHYMAYGEWRADPGESESRVVASEPDHTVHVLRCPWQRAWEDNELLPFGRLYCQEIDVALVRGFNPDLQLDVNTTLTNDHLPCEFVYHGADPELVKDLSVDQGQTVMPWAYHLGHLYATMGQVLKEQLGREGEKAMREALECFSERFGESAAQDILMYRDTDFDGLID